MRKTQTVHDVRETFRLIKRADAREAMAADDNKVKMQIQILQSETNKALQAAKSATELANTLIKEKAADGRAQADRAMSVVDSELSRQNQRIAAEESDTRASEQAREADEREAQQAKEQARLQKPQE